MREVSNEHRKGMFMKKRLEDVSSGYILAFIFVNLVILLLDANNIPSKHIRCPMMDLDAYDMMKFHIETTGIISAILGYFISKLNDRILDISIKFWMMKKTVYKLNILTCIVAIIITNVFAILAFITKTSIFMLINFCVFLCIFLRLVYMEYVYAAKRSWLYSDVMKVIFKNKSEGKRLANKIKKKWLFNYTYSKDNIENCDISKKEKAHNSYILEELVIHYLVREKCEDEEKNYINTHAKKLLLYEKRDSKDIKEYVKGNVKEFSKYVGYKDDFMKWIYDLIEA